MGFEGFIFSSSRRRGAETFVSDGILSACAKSGGFGYHYGVNLHIFFFCIRLSLFSHLILLSLFVGFQFWVALYPAGTIPDVDDDWFHCIVLREEISDDSDHAGRTLLQPISILIFAGIKISLNPSFARLSSSISRFFELQPDLQEQAFQCIHKNGSSNAAERLTHYNIVPDIAEQVSCYSQNIDRMMT
jgi:hypothetical protein